MKNIKIKKIVLRNEKNNFLLVLRPMRKELSHLSTTIHSESRLDDNDNFVEGYSYDNTEYFTTSKTDAITQARETLIHNEIMDFVFDNGLENILF